MSEHSPSPGSWYPDSPGIHHEPKNPIKLLKERQYQEYKPQSSPELVVRYKIFQEILQSNCDFIYHPCCGTDISPSEAFSKIRVL